VSRVTALGGDNGQIRRSSRRRSDEAKSGKVAQASRFSQAPVQEEIASMTHVEEQLGFDRRSAPAAPSLQAIKTAVLLVALILYAAGFVVLYPLAASSVAASAAAGDGPELTQFVGP
jgi:hypothetical protein